jgi:peptidyl-prolyl cis-trans isomerase SurA
LLQKLNKGNALNVSFTQGNFQRGENTVLDMVTWQQGGHTVNHNDRFHYVYIEQVEAARAKTLDEARGQVIADYQQYLEQQWIEQLRQRYTYSVSEAEFKKLIKVSQ